MPRLLLVDDHDVVREGVKRIVLRQIPDAAFEETGAHAKALLLLSGQSFDIVILDIALNGATGLVILKELREIRKAPILILTMHSEQQYARRAFKAGATGFISKGASGAELLAAINRVLAGGKYVSPAFAERLINGGDCPEHTLSSREFEVMSLIASGRTLGEIAAALLLSHNTISTYRVRVLTKMGMKTNAELARYVIENELTPGSEM